jgi:hypothetical protein
MRPVVLQFWISLDGYSPDAGTQLRQFMERMPEDDGDGYFVSALRQAGTHIMGLVTYEDMAKVLAHGRRPGRGTHERHPEGCVLPDTAIR